MDLIRFNFIEILLEFKIGRTFVVEQMTVAKFYRL